MPDPSNDAASHSSEIHANLNEANDNDIEPDPSDYAASQSSETSADSERNDHATTNEDAEDDSSMEAIHKRAYAVPLEFTRDLLRSMDTDSRNNLWSQSGTSVGVTPKLRPKYRREGRG